MELSSSAPSQAANHLSYQRRQQSPPQPLLLLIKQRSQSWLVEHSSPEFTSPTRYLQIKLRQRCIRLGAQLHKHVRFIHLEGRTFDFSQSQQNPDPLGTLHDISVPNHGRPAPSCVGCTPRQPQSQCNISPPSSQTPSFARARRSPILKEATTVTMIDVCPRSTRSCTLQDQHARVAINTRPRRRLHLHSGPCCIRASCADNAPHTI